MLWRRARGVKHSDGDHKVLFWAVGGNMQQVDEISGSGEADSIDAATKAAIAQQMQLKMLVM